MNATVVTHYAMYHANPQGRNAAPRAAYPGFAGATATLLVSVLVNIDLAVVAVEVGAPLAVSQLAILLATALSIPTAQLPSRLLCPIGIRFSRG